ncbi:hypothetical protein [Stenotrophomonas cyclobalanopsidis]|uniref:hypothetical protein n=1 Tax=Stenotrophomonas cyclobalanopsidis TaxID=2771362 RepID=UPI00165F1670|nr:hypothetical protein [Stenotrophomonas cyclobalanopsidis]
MLPLGPRSQGARRGAADLPSVNGPQARHVDHPHSRREVAVARGRHGHATRAGKARLRARNARGEHPFQASDAEFEQITRHFVAPAPEEGFQVIRYVAEGFMIPDSIR